MDEQASQRRVLLVDENWSFRGFAAHALRRADFDVVEAETTKIALELMERESALIDVVICEVRFRDGTTGQAVMETLRKMNGNLKVIFVSGSPDDALELAQGDAHLAKPCEIRELLAKVSELA
jgi:CheY-like chemotaxis protein